MFGEICVLHHAKSGPETAGAEGAWLDAAAAEGDPGWFLETCQRRVMVFPGGHPWSRRTPPEGLDLHQGTDAYRFLLLLATGLESRVAGETNILGQMKSAWSHHARGTRWLQWLFADAKEIRSRFLSQIGGASYGRLVQQLLRRQGVGPGATVLLVGAGALAAEVAPWLRGWNLKLSNRTPGRAQDIAGKLRLHPGKPVEVVPGDAAEAAWKSADAIVPCIPFDDGQDGERCRWLRDGRPGKPATTVIHLAGARRAAGAWTELAGFLCLDDLFELHESLDGIRVHRLARARRACDERADHRDLGAALSLAHGWEDLSAFSRADARELAPA